MSEIRILVILIGAVLGALIAKKKEKSVILGLLVGGVIATIFVEIVFGVLRGLGY